MRSRRRSTPIGAASSVIGASRSRTGLGVHRELKRKHVTFMILWDECIAANPGGYSYSRFCELYRAFEKTPSVTMRQTLLLRTLSLRPREVEARLTVRGVEIFCEGERIAVH
jgi:hypothetical protein